MGRALEFSDGPRTTRLLMAVMQAFGVNVETLGDLKDESSRGALPGVLRAL